NTFLGDARNVAKEIVALSFDFAKAQAALLSKRASNPASPGEAPDTRSYSGLARAAAAADKEMKDAQAELDGDRQKLASATGARQRQLQSTVDELQAEVNLAKTRSDTFKSILQFVGTGTSGSSLQSQINELQRTVPELAADGAKAAGA